MDKEDDLVSMAKEAGSITDKHDRERGEPLQLRFQGGKGPD